MTPADPVGRIEVLRVECEKCAVRGATTWPDWSRRGADAKLTDWLYGLTADCPRRRAARLSDQDAARCPALLPLIRGRPASLRPTISLPASRCPSASCCSASHQDPTG